MRQDYRVIVEGMDGGGKTYLINYLIKRFPQFELIVNNKGPNQDFNTWWPAQLEREKSDIVPLHDRFFYSELVYGPIIRGSIEANPLVIGNVTWFLRTTSLLIYVRPPVKVIKARVLANPQMDGVHEHFQELIELYDNIMMAERSWYGPRFVHYTADSLEEQVRVGDIVGAYLGVGS